jgi:hypothetical protein
MKFGFGVQVPAADESRAVEALRQAGFTIEPRSNPDWFDVVIDYVHAEDHVEGSYFAAVGVIGAALMEIGIPHAIKSWGHERLPR